MSEYEPIVFVDQANPLAGNPEDPRVNAASLAHIQSQYAEVLDDVENGTGPIATALNAALQPLAREWFAPSMFFLTSGTPLLTGSFALRWQAWLLDAAVLEGITAPVRVPSNWSTMDVYVEWANAVASAGNVVLGGSLDSAAPGASVNVTGPAIPDVTFAAAGQYVRTRSLLQGGVAVTPANLHGLRLFRRAADVADTLAGDIAILGVELVRAS